jgi:YegS/Rv2252/BmrU family lipid kinase
MTRRALLIVNSRSRTGKAALNAAIDGLRRHGVDPLHRECGSREQLSPLIVEHGRDMDMVVVGGGDGTLNAAAAGVVKVKRPMGILPTGTANDLARTLGIPNDLDSAIKIVAAANTRFIDVGSVNDKLFFNVASIGLSAELAQELTRDVKRRFGKLGYALAAIRVLSRARPFRAEIFRSNGRVHSTTLQVAVGNGRFYGGGNVVASDAEIDDGKLDLYSLEFLRAWRLVLMLRSFRRGEHAALSEVRGLRDNQFEIHTRHPRPVNADGEIVTQTPATFRLLPKALEVIIPGPANDQPVGTVERADLNHAVAQET